MESAWFQHLKLRYEKLLLSFVFHFNLRRYTTALVPDSLRYLEVLSR
jgi:hypothetical protein